jgi:hypothetical protein
MGVTARVSESLLTKAKCWQAWDPVEGWADLVDVALVGPLRQLNAEAVDVLDPEDGGQFGSFPGSPGLSGQQLQDLAAPVRAGQVR